MIEAMLERLEFQQARIGGGGPSPPVAAPIPIRSLSLRAPLSPPNKLAALLFSDIDRAPASSTIRSSRSKDHLPQGPPARRRRQALIQQIYRISRDPRFLGKVFFIENYDIQVARYLVSGCDVWLNTPRRPLEASGTSGQKTTVHGCLNLSILDGWWREGYDGTNGFAIGE